MIIRKLRASFGKLEGESLRFHDGLNVIYAPNESGVYPLIAPAMKLSWIFLLRKI